VTEAELYAKADEVLRPYLASKGFRRGQPAEYLRKPMEQLYQSTGEDRGFPCGPYLNPVRVTKRPKYWSYKDVATLSKSLNHVMSCLENAGLPWLASLRDPKVFAKNVDPIAAMGAALANEAAGNRDEARKFYGEMMRRYTILLKDFGEDAVLKQDGKAFVFVAKKLNIEPELCRRFEERLNYHPTVVPL
jgi:hypothetical protein